MRKDGLAFIGLGAMGRLMAERLLAAGHTLRVFDLVEATTRPLVAAGAIPCSSPCDAATGTRAVFVCLPSPAACIEAALGPAGIVEAPDVGLYVEMSTIGMAAVSAIAAGLDAIGTPVVDAPVSGGPRKARTGDLTIMAAGAPVAIATVRPFLETITNRIFYAGDKVGHGQIAKLANNMIAATGMAAAFEAVTMATKAGIDPRVLIDVVNASTGRNTATLDKFPVSVLPRTFDYGARISTMYKDVALALGEAHHLSTPMWVGSHVEHLWFHAMTQGRGNDDFTTLIKMIEEWAGLSEEHPSEDKQPESLGGENV